METRAPDSVELAAYLDSLPKAYEERYSSAEIESHRAACETRAATEPPPPAWVGLTPSRHGLVGLCIVASDRRGLFACILAALRLRQFDIVSAETYTRQRGDSSEVVDIFQLRYAGDRELNKRSPADMAAGVCHTLLGLLDKSIDPHQSLPASRRGGREDVVDTNVRFVEGDAGNLAILEVETDDRGGLLLNLAEALTRHPVSIVRSEVVTLGNRVRDRFTLAAADGGAVESSLRLDIQVAVLSAIQFAF